MLLIWSFLVSAERRHRILLLREHLLATVLGPLRIGSVNWRGFSTLREGVPRMLLLDLDFFILFFICLFGLASLYMDF